MAAERAPTAESPPAAGDLPEPLLAFVDQAISEGATDIHIDVWSERALVRYRVDGVIHTKEELTPGQAQRVINQLKVAARLQADTVREPVEGHFRHDRDGRRRNVRVTIIPAGRHHSAHLRLLAAHGEWREIRQLGLGGRHLERLEVAMAGANGLILVAGPTGSGKTTTLYALADLADPERRIVTSIEDPIEFDLPNVRQLEVDETHGLTMEAGLKALLRMDPDVMMIGEIRDRASATIAAHAALAGRLVLGTVHGSDAAGAIESMHYLTVPNYVLGGALRIVIGQNLVRKLCRDCVKRRPIAAPELAIFKEAGAPAPETVSDPGGCDACHGYGFHGRTGVFEVMSIGDDLGHWIARGQPQHAIRRRFGEVGGRPMLAHALEKVADGITSMSEILPLRGHRAGDEE